MRMRHWVPLPHFDEQCDHGLQAVVAQSTGHRTAAHGVVSCRAPQVAPWPVAARTMERVRVRVPWSTPPQVMSHALHEDHVDATQSFVHAWVLQSLFSNSDGHVYPLCAACVLIMRVRRRCPRPHDFVQVDQLPHNET